MSHTPYCRVQHPLRSTYELHPVLELVGEWVITTYGLEWAGEVAPYPIEWSRLSETDWVKHLGEKNWVEGSSVEAAVGRAYSWHFALSSSDRELFSWAGDDNVQYPGAFVSFALLDNEEVGMLDDAQFRSFITDMLRALRKP